MVYDPTGMMSTRRIEMGGNPDMISRSLNSQTSALPLTGMNDPRQSVRGPGMMPGIAPGGGVYNRMRRGSLSDALSRMREKMLQRGGRRPPGLPPRRSPGGPFGPSGPGRLPRFPDTPYKGPLQPVGSPGQERIGFGPVGQEPTRRMPPQLDPSKGRAGMDRIMNLLRGTRNPMDRMSPDRTRGGRPNFGGLGSGRGTFKLPPFFGPMQPRPQDIEPEIRTMPNRPVGGGRGRVSQSSDSYEYPTTPSIFPQNNKVEIFKQQIPPRGMQEGGEVNPLDDLYAQIGVEDENTAREVIEKILSGQSADLSEAQQGLLGGGIYRRIANRLGMRDRAGNLITPISSVEVSSGNVATPDAQQALRNLLDMEKTESGTGIETLLNYLQGRRRPREVAEGQEPEATGPFGLVDFASGGPQFPGPGGGYPQYPLYPQPPVFGEVSMPSIPQSPFLPYAGMANPMNPNIFGGYGYGFGPSMGMAPINYYGGFQPPPGVFEEKTGEGGDVDPGATVVTNT